MKKRSRRLRLLHLMRPSVGPGLLLSVGLNRVIQASTPFLIALIAEEYQTGLALASLIGVGQLGGFAIGSWAAGRCLSPRRRVFVTALLVVTFTNLASASLPPFAVLIVLRALSGFAMGIVTWFAWVQVFGEERGTGDLAVMGPITGIVAAPMIAVFALGGGPAAIFVLLAALSVIPMLFSRGSGATEHIPGTSQRSKPVVSATVLLGALGVFIFGGSSIISYAVVLAEENAGISASAVSLLFSANAIAEIPAAKWPWRRGWPAPWLAAAASCGFVLAVADNVTMYGVAITFWGFAFWMAIPGVFGVLASQSAHPADRAGDAQAVMAGGRVIGPLVGGLVLDNFGSTALGLVGGGLMLSGAAVVFGVRALIPPTDAIADTAV